MEVVLFEGDLVEFLDLFQESTGLTDETAIKKLIAIEVARGTSYGVIRVDGLIVGMVGLYVDDVPGVRELEPAQIIDFAVREEFRGRGFGKILMDWAVERARSFGCDALWLYTGGGESIGKIYRSLGFVEAGRNEGFWEGKWDRVWFRRSL
ncbi:MAG: GNAT family N-acetyltransferase [Fimbriimonadaceae bacterium]